MATKSPDVHGVLVVDKPGLAPDTTLPLSDERSLFTSHDVVQRVRRLSGQRRIGHTGTLDPMASGVLVLCLGQATRLAEYYQGHDKRYLAEITLGAATDTYDALGAVTATSPHMSVDATLLHTALDRFRGTILQTPPIYSALKQGGESLYRKARRGESATITPRQITIHVLDLVDWNGVDRLRLRVVCSAGTYLRSLAHELGQALGGTAHLSALRREAAGAFTLEQAHTLAALEQAAAGQRLAEHLLPIGAGLDLPMVLLAADTARRLSQGQKVDLPDSAQGALPHADGLVGARDKESGEFLGIIRRLAQRDDGGGQWKAEKWLATP